MRLRYSLLLLFVASTAALVCGCSRSNAIIAIVTPTSTSTVPTATPRFQFLSSIDIANRLTAAGLPAQPGHHPVTVIPGFTSYPDEVIVEKKQWVDVYQFSSPSAASAALPFALSLLTHQAYLRPPHVYVVSNLIIYYVPLHVDDTTAAAMDSAIHG